MGQTFNEINGRKSIGSGDPRGLQIRWRAPGVLGRFDSCLFRQYPTTPVVGTGGRAEPADGEEAQAGSRQRREFFDLLRRRRVWTIGSVRVGVSFLTGSQARKSGATIRHTVARIRVWDRAQIGVDRLEVGVGHAVIGGP